MTAVEWPREKVGTALKVRYGKALPKSERDELGDFPVVGSAGRMTGTARPLINDPAVIIGRKGNAGQVQLELAGCWPIDTTYYATVPDRIDARFLRWQLHALHLGDLDSSTATPSLRREDLEAQELVVPALDEQYRIVTILENHLSRLDAAEKSLATAQRRLTVLRDQMILRAITGAEDGARSAKELPPVGATDGALPPLPADWRWARLGEVADVVGGVTKDAKKQSDPSYVEVPYLRVANVQRGHLNLDNVSTIRVPVTKADSLRLRRGDVLLNEGGDRDKLARGWIWEEQVADCIHQNHVFRARVKEPRLTPEFLSFTANSIGGPWAERNGKQSVNLASISLKMIRQMPVIVPPEGMAESAISALIDRLAEIDRMRWGVAAALSRSATLRRSLLAAAFSGSLTGSSTEISEVAGKIAI